MLSQLCYCSKLWLVWKNSRLFFLPGMKLGDSDHVGGYTSCSELTKFHMLQYRNLDMLNSSSQILRSMRSMVKKCTCCVHLFVILVYLSSVWICMETLASYHWHLFIKREKYWQSNTPAGLVSLEFSVRLLVFFLSKVLMWVCYFAIHLCM